MQITVNSQTIEVDGELEKRIMALLPTKAQWKPKAGDEFYCLDSMGVVCRLTYGNSGLYYPYIDFGNCYQTPELATEAGERRKAIVRLWDWADKNEPFEPDWSDDGQEKWCVGYSHPMKSLFMESLSGLQYQFELPHFKTRDSATRFIEECADDLELWRRG